MADNRTNGHVERAWKFCQNCLRANPVLIVGSGASVSYGLPTMGSLGDDLVTSLEKENPTLLSDAIWNNFKRNLKEIGLEQAIDITDIWKNNEIYSAIKTNTWRCIINKDALVHKLVLNSENALALSSLLTHLFNSDNNLVRVVTTNYDRLIEYASEAAGILWRTNFQSGHMGAWRGDKPTLEFWNYGKKVPEKTLELWKVHGSLDWLLFENTGIRSVPGILDLPQGASPLIVPPSIKKLAETHEDPFRKIIHAVDTVLREAHSFFCVGYGFNDNHIQVKLFERARRDRKPVVILTKRLTESARTLFLQDDGQIDFCAFEEAENNGTMMYDKQNRNGVLIEGCNVWDLSHFVNEII